MKDVGKPDHAGTMIAKRTQVRRNEVPLNLVPNQALIVSLIFTVLPFCARAESPVSYMSPVPFGDCIAIVINAQGGKAYFKNRKELAKNFRNEAINTSKYIQTTSSQLNFLNRQIFYSSAFASLPFIDFTSPNMDIWLRKLALESTLFQIYGQNNPISPIDRTDLAGMIFQVEKGSANFDARVYVNKDDFYFASQQRAASIANPLVTWLIQQPRASVSHWTFLKYATQIYGDDILTALGVIGELFWQETLQASPNRIKNAVLASKMKPLVSPDTSNPVGDNYHFWQILAAAYYEGGTELGRLYSKIDSNDPGHILANSLGLDVADRTMAQIGNKGISCILK